MKSFLNLKELPEEIKNNILNSNIVSPRFILDDDLVNTVTETFESYKTRRLPKSVDINLFTPLFYHKYYKLQLNKPDIYKLETELIGFKNISGVL